MALQRHFHNTVIPAKGDPKDVWGSGVVAGAFHLCATTVRVCVYEKMAEPFGTIFHEIN